MLAMNYQITLPSDFDMETLREQIPLIGKRFDDYEGLGLKAFLFRKSGENGSLVNQYAPFYLWTEEAAAASFLWSGKQGSFNGVVGRYGRPTVQTWIGGSFHRGTAYGQTPLWAIRTVERLPADADPTATAEVYHAALAHRSNEEGLHSAAFAIDPRTWEVVTLALHAERPNTVVGELYEVPYLSAPGINQLA